MIAAFKKPVGKVRLVQETHLHYIYFSSSLLFILTFFSAEFIFLLQAFIGYIEFGP